MYVIVCVKRVCVCNMYVGVMCMGVRVLMCMGCNVYGCV